MYIVKRILGSLEARLSQPRLSIWRTLYFNFRTLPFAMAIKLPIFIYGKVRLFILSGEVEFLTTNVYRGMVKIGKNTESFSLFDHSGFIQINEGCKLIFEGSALIGINTKIRLVSSQIVIGNNAFIASNVRLIANGSSIYIGEGSRIAFESILMNSSFHYVYNVSKQCYARNSNPIYIGCYNWIGNRTTVSGGTKTKPYTIVCSGSLLNKDYTKNEEENVMLAGQPAKVIAIGVKRVFSPTIHQKVDEYFRINPSEKVYVTQELMN